MFALPFLDRGPNRHPWAPSRRVFTLLFSVVGAGIVALTVMGLRDAPVRFDPNVWGPQSMAGYLTAEDGGNPCARCHVDGGPASPVQVTRISRDEGWLTFHMSDPAAIAAGAKAVDPTAEPMLDETRPVPCWRISAGCAPASPPGCRPHRPRS
jgi:hypothetical protein